MAATAGTSFLSYILTSFPFFNNCRICNMQTVGVAIPISCKNDIIQAIAGLRIDIL